MPTLLTISDDLTALAELLDDLPDGELTPEAELVLDTWFADLTDQRDTKLDNYAAMIRERQLRAAARQEEAERLQKSASADSNLVRRLKDRLKLFMDLQNLKRIETRRYRLSVQTNGGKQAVQLLVSPEYLPDKFRLVHYEAHADALRAALESGDPDAAAVARLQPRGVHLRVQ